MEGGLGNEDAGAVIGVSSGEVESAGGEVKADGASGVVLDAVLARTAKTMDCGQEVCEADTQGTEAMAQDAEEAEAGSEEAEAATVATGRWCCRSATSLRASPAPSGRGDGGDRLRWFIPRVGAGG